MTEETRSKLSLMNLTDAPKKAYTVPIPKDGLIYDYRLLREGTGKWVNIYILSYLLILFQ